MTIPFSGSGTAAAEEQLLLVGILLPLLLMLEYGLWKDVRQRVGGFEKNLTLLDQPDKRTNLVRHGNSEVAEEIFGKLYDSPICAVRVELMCKPNRVEWKPSAKVARGVKIFLSPLPEEKLPQVD